MSLIPQWTIDDLIARYELEPKLRDVFVEGEFDKDVLTECFRNVGVTHAVAYAVDAVEIPNELLAQSGLQSGKKSEVIALSIALGALDQASEVRFLVDSDLDYWFDSRRQVPRLVWTEYPSLEVYFLSEEFTRTLVTTVAKAKILQWSELYASFLSVLRELFVLRLADREMDLRLRWLSPNKSLRIHKGQIVFDKKDYVKRLLLSSGRGRDREPFEGRIQAWTARCTGNDARFHTRGHDYVELIAWTIGKAGGLREFSSVAAIERTLVLSALCVAPLLVLFGWVAPHA